MMAFGKLGARGGFGGMGTVGRAGSVGPLVLPGTPAAVFSAVRTPTWAGKFAQIQRVSDNATFDIPFKGNVPDYAAAATFVGGSTAGFSKLYDQSGNGNDLTQVLSAAAQPAFTTASLVNGILPVCFDGVQSAVIKYFNMPTTLSLSRIGHSWFKASRNCLSLTYQAIGPEFQTSGGAAIQVTTVIDPDSGFDEGVVSYDGATYKSLLRPRGQMATLAARFGASNTKLTVNGTSATAAASTALTMNTGGVFGSSNLGTSFALKDDLFALVFYASAVDDPTHDAVLAQFNKAFSIPSSFTTRLIYGGSSGIVSYGSTLNQIVTRKIAMPSNVEIYNLGISGQSLATEQTNSATRELALYDGTKARNIIVMDAPSNDIAAQTFTSSSDAVTKTTTLYNAITIGFVQAIQAKGASARAVVPTVIPRNGFDTTTNWFETARTTYNGLVTSGAVANGYTVIDPTTDPAFSTQLAWQNATNYFADGIHPNDTGYTKYAAIARAALLPLVV